MTVSEALGQAFSVLAQFGLIDIIKAFLLVALAGAFLGMIRRLRE